MKFHHSYHGGELQFKQRGQKGGEEVWIQPGEGKSGYLDIYFALMKKGVSQEGGGFIGSWFCLVNM